MDIFTTLLEYIISSALKQFAENPKNHSCDAEVAGCMIEEIENHDRIKLRRDLNAYNR